MISWSSLTKHSTRAGRGNFQREILSGHYAAQTAQMPVYSLKFGVGLSLHGKRLSHNKTQ